MYYGYFIHSLLCHPDTAKRRKGLCTLSQEMLPYVQHDKNVALNISYMLISNSRYHKTVKESFRIHITVGTYIS